MLENSDDLKNWLLLANTHEVGPKTFFKLLRYFETIDRVLGASVSELVHVEGIGHKTAEHIARTRNAFDVDSELQLADKLGVKIITFPQDSYPTVLRRIDDPPPVLYLKGTIEKSDNLAVAIVGSRRSSLYGQEQASRFAHLLASSGFTIVSGMARGIDTSAHHGALSAKGRTIAVQGCGLANIFPEENKTLFEKIPSFGACVSELPLRTEPIASNFPPRNRIIAGLSLATIVIEATVRSGAMITAKMAADYNREVMAMPGKIDSPLSKGPHLLLKQGAKLVDSIEDIMETLGYIGNQLNEHTAAASKKATDSAQMPLFQPHELNLSPTESTIYKILTREPIHIEQIITAANIAPGPANSGLIQLRLKGLISQLPGNFFSKK